MAKQGYMEITYGWLKDFLESLLYGKTKDGFFPTGSKCFGMDTPDSDFDFVVMKEIWNSIHPEAYQLYGKRFNAIEGIHNESGHAPDYEFEVIRLQIKVQLNEFFFNFILVSDLIEYKIWVYSTRLFQKIIDSNNIMKSILSVKEKRVELFEQFKTMFREYFENR